jgi:hypothetical protein
MSAAIVDLLIEFWALADRHKASLDQYRDPCGDADEDFYAEYDEARTTASTEAIDFLNGVMGELAALYPLPLGLEIALLGADGETVTVTTGQLDDRARTAFIRGQCHALARALFEVTGWTMAVIISDEWSSSARTARSSTSTAHTAPGKCPTTRAISTSR